MPTAEERQAATPILEELTKADFAALEAGTKTSADVAEKSWRQHEILTGQRVVRPIGVDKIGGDATAFMGGFSRRVMPILELMDKRYGHLLPENCVFRLATMAEWESALKANSSNPDDVYVKWNVTNGGGASTTCVPTMFAGVAHG